MPQHCGPILGFPSGSDGQESACNTGDPGSIPGLGRLPEGGTPTPVFLPEESHGQRSLVGYSPWDCKESDTKPHRGFHLALPFRLEMKDIVLSTLPT